MSSYDARAWQGPHAFAVHRREERVLLAVIVAVPFLIVGLRRLIDSVEGLPPTAGAATFVLTFCMAFAAPMWAFRVVDQRRWGWVTIGPGAQTFEWRHHRDTHRSPPRLRRAAELLDVQESDGNCGLDDRFSGTVTLMFDDTTFLIRVPTGHASELAASLREGLVP